MHSKKMICLLALLMLFGFCLSAPAHAFNSFIKFLSTNSCQHLSNAGKSGCYAYLEARIIQHSSPNEALSKGKARCDRWSDIKADPAKLEKCYGGCQFLRNKE